MTGLVYFISTFILCTTSTYAISTDLSDPANIHDPANARDTGTYVVPDKTKVEKQKMEDQLIMEKEEAVEKDEYDAFGENKYNWNYDPKIYEEEKPKPKSKAKGAR